MKNNEYQQPSLSSIDNIISKVVKEELKYQRIRDNAYEEMITIAEQQFSVSIRKKLESDSKEPACTGSEVVSNHHPVQAVWLFQAGIFQECRRSENAENRTRSLCRRIHT